MLGLEAVTPDAAATMIGLLLNATATSAAARNMFTFWRKHPRAADIGALWLVSSERRLVDSFLLIVFLRWRHKNLTSKGTESTT